jgi:S-DNA-T family DNA segregation ATPase FtsK/SpoIIIE
MVLGDNAYKRGALCDQISADMPGVGYVQLPGSSDFIRVRAAYVTDTDIADMVESYRPPTAVADQVEAYRAGYATLPTSNGNAAQRAPPRSNGDRVVAP